MGQGICHGESERSTPLNTIVTIILFVLLLTVIICIHEAGHLFAAKKFGVYCFEYSFGMGPVLFQRKKNETLYSIRALPVGGYVSMAGEQDGDAAYPDVEVPEGRRLTDQKPWKKVIIMLAGVFMNFLLAFVIFSMIVLSNGAYAKSPKAEIRSVTAGSPAETAGLEAGDVITKVILSDGSSSKVKTFTDLQYAMASVQEEPVTLEVMREGETLDITVTPVWNEEYQSWMIGIQGPDAQIVKVNLLNCWVYGIDEMHTLTKATWSAFVRIFTGDGINQLSGPVGIYSATEQSASYGIIGYLFLIAELSLNIGIFNLIPLPVLDGGQVVITIVEAIIHKPVNEKVKIGIMTVTWALLITLMIFVTWHDIARLAG